MITLAEWYPPPDTYCPARVVIVCACVPALCRTERIGGQNMKKSKRAQQRHIIAEIEKLGGLVQTDPKAPNNPIIAIDLRRRHLVTPTTVLNDVLKFMEGLSARETRTLYGAHVTAAGLRYRKGPRHLDAIDNQPRGQVGTIVVHCEGGLSRSPAVAAALSEGLGLDGRRFWRDYNPSTHVYHCLMEVFDERGTLNAENFTGGSQSLPRSFQCPWRFGAAGVARHRALDGREPWCRGHRHAETAHGSRVAARR